MSITVNLNPKLPRAIVKSFGLPKMFMADVGCSGGISPEWARHSFVQAIGFDPLVAEIDRLKAAAAPNQEYVCAFITGPDGEPNRVDTWFDRASFWTARQALEKNQRKESSGPAKEIGSANEAEHSPSRLTLDDYFDGKAIHFLKTDTDGFDYQVLRGSTRLLENVIGVHCEANFHAFGPHTTVWRDIDAFLSRRGFALAELTPARYTRIALPGRFSDSGMANTREGAIAWADCLYLRDSTQLTGEDLLRLAIIAEIYSLPDVSAEALLKFGDEVGRDKIEYLLDCLVAYSPFPKIGSYTALLRKFQTDPKSFIAK